MKYFDTLNAEEQISYLIKPILKVLSQTTTPLKPSEIRSKIVQVDNRIAEFANTEYTSKLTGNTYKKFTIKFGLALKELIVLDIVNRDVKNKWVTLTPIGRALDIDALDVENDIRKKAQVYWKARRKKITKKKTKAANVAKNEKRL